MQCMYGINLIRRSEISGQPKTYNLTFCNKYLEDNSKKYIADYIEKRYADRVEDLEMWRLRLKKVEDMFS
ncbi:hypothetical protein BTO02_05325 [Paraburkholderia sp. SOS3]|nr:hypothetical protein BTO02_05325 [Paraburkholderia sp. SOS3]